MSQLRLGVALSYLTILIVNVVGLILTPFIVKSLGASEYGLYTLIGSFVAYLSVLDFGMNNAVIRYVAKYKVKNDKYAEENFLALSLIVYLAISILVMLFGGYLYLKFEYYFANSLTAVEIDKAKLMFLILIFNLIFSLPGGIFIAICTGREKFVFSKSVALVKYLFRSILVFFVLLKGGDAISIVVVDTIANLLLISISSYYVLIVLKVKFKLHDFDFLLIKNIFEYSFWIFISAVTFNFYWQSGQFILGITENTKAVAIFGIGVLLGGYYASFASVINSMLVPRAMQLVETAHDPSLITSLIIKYGRINLIVLLLILSGFYLFGTFFIILWVGETYIEAAQIALIIMLALTLPLVQGFGNSILEAKRKNRFKSILSLFSTGIGVLAGWHYSFSYGMVGIITSLALSMVFNSIIMMFYYRHIFEFEIGSFLLGTYFKPLLVVSLLVYLSKSLTMKYLPTNWIDLATGVFIYTLSYILLTYTFILNKSEKKSLRNKVL